MKKSAKSILIFGIILVVALSLAILNACDKTDKIDSSSDEHKHTYGEWSVITAATCTTDGSKKRACTICQKEETEIISAIGHSYGNWTTVTEATCTTGGQKKHTCSVCEYEETENISALGHDEIRHEAKAATCTEIGWEAYVTCSRCDYTTFAEIPAIGHNFVDDECTYCHELKATEGLNFTFNNNTQSYSVSSYNGESTAIIIPNNYDDGINGEYSVTSIGRFAFSGCSGLTSVTIGNSVTSIGNCAFYNCSGLTSVTMGNSVTSIGNCAFENCSGLSSITIDSNVTSISSDAFRGCSALTSVTIGDSVTSVPGRSGMEVWAFSNFNITSIIVSEGNSVYHSAGNCIIETETNTLIIGCETSVIPTDGSVTSIGMGAFAMCAGLTSIIIPNSVTSIGIGAFAGCVGLTSITIPNSVTSIEMFAFVYCESLSSVTMGNSVTSIGMSAFEDCSGLTSIEVASGNTKYHSSGNCLIETETKTLILGCKTSVIPDDGSVTSIGERAFYNCSGLTSITIPTGVTSIGSSAFCDCDGLTSVTIGNGLTSIGNEAFAYCSGLTSVTYNGTESAWNNINIGDGNDALINATKHFLPDGPSEEPTEEFTEGLSYSLSADETSYTVVGIGTAKDTDIVIPSRYNGLPVTNIGGGAFLSCNSMTSITIPAGVTSIEMGAFDDCSGLTTIYYRGNIASWCGIRGLDNVMSSTRSLYIDGIKVEGALVIPDGASKIEEFAFVGCCGVTSVTVGNGVASIGRGAFMSCEDITQITIDNAEISIDALAFAYCNKITSITYNGTTAQWENVTKGENWVYGTNITVHCTDGDVTVA